eukprot:snap_masked-scaffold_6-processed-gene-2.21-mRNA-1 protein AED:1.00 eAED:1.00 QI:0/0/0/0/1/1/2/0/64
MNKHIAEEKLINSHCQKAMKSILALDKHFASSKLRERVLHSINPYTDYLKLLIMKKASILEPID